MTDRLLRVIEIDDDAWDQECIDADPHESRAYLRGVALTRGLRPVLVVAEGGEWKASYVLLLSPLSTGRWLARTPEYGGPWFDTSNVPVAAREMRPQLDATLRSLDVVSEVFALGPWLHGRDEIAHGWDARPEKRIFTTSLRDLAQLRRSFRKGRRADIARGARDFEVRVGPLTGEGAEQFAFAYTQAMQRIGAADRWQLGPEYFVALVEAGADLTEVQVSRGCAGATAIFLTAEARASYLFATRVGDAPGAASAALWHGMAALADRSVVDLNLGGGVGDGDDDPLLRFKRSMSSGEAILHLGARCFDSVAHAAAVVDGVARPLPDGAVKAATGTDR